MGPSVDYSLARCGEGTNKSVRPARLHYDISDPGNQGAADVTYWVVEGNVGPISNFSKEGGASVRARRIGSAPACAA